MLPYIVRPLVLHVLFYSTARYARALRPPPTRPARAQGRTSTSESILQYRHPLRPPPTRLGGRNWTAGPLDNFTYTFCVWFVCVFVTSRPTEGLKLATVDIWTTTAGGQQGNLPFYSCMFLCCVCVFAAWTTLDSWTGILHIFKMFSAVKYCF